MSFAQNVEFINKINIAMVNIMKDGKIDKNDIPTIVLLITELITSSGKVVKSDDDDDDTKLSDSINGLYDYIMGHYKLFPADDVLKTEFKTLFDICIKLVLYQPNITTITTKYKQTLSCFGCKRDVRNSTV